MQEIVQVVDRVNKTRSNGRNCFLMLALPQLLLARNSSQITNTKFGYHKLNKATSPQDF